MSLTVDQIRRRAKKVFLASGVEYATTNLNKLTGLRDWTPGVVIEDARSKPPRSGVAVVRNKDGRDSHIRDVAVAALRAAGWTVRDNGVIVSVPE